MENAAGLALWFECILWNVSLLSQLHCQDLWSQKVQSEKKNLKKIIP